MREAYFKTLATLAAMVLVTAPTFAQQGNADIENIGNRDINRGGFRPMIPDPEAEIAMGTQIARDLEQRVTLLQDPVVADYVNRVGQNIVRNSDARVPFTIRIVDSAEINAVGLPGGFLYVNTGLIIAADNEAQLAAMMAHAIAHVTARHAAEQQGRAALLNVLSLPSSVFTGGIASQALNQPNSTAVPLMFLKFSRGAEEEADWLGLQYTYKAGYDPVAMVRFFEKIAAQEPAPKVSTLYSSHPQTSDRIAKTTENIKSYLAPRQQNIVTTTEFQDVKTRLAERK